MTEHQKHSFNALLQLLCATEVTLSLQPCAAVKLAFTDKQCLQLHCNKKERLNGMQYSQLHQTP